jgi:hypothetical protein
MEQIGAGRHQSHWVLPSPARAETDPPARGAPPPVGVPVPDDEVLRILRGSVST